MIFKRLRKYQKNISTHNDKTHKSELPFIDTNEFSVYHQNYEKIIRDEWLTEDLISFFLDILNLDLKHSLNVNEEAPTFV